MGSKEINMQEEVEKEEDDGPPPGFQCIITQRPPQLEKVEVGDEDDDEEGPPPGFQFIITPKPPGPEKVEVDDDDDDDEEEPPPGFNSIVPKSSPSLPSSDTERISKHQDINDEDGAPPGWEFSSLANALPKPPSDMAEIKLETNKEVDEGKDEDEGPPPGWETVLPHQMPPPCTQPSKQLSAVSSDIDIESKQEIARNDNEAPQSVPKSTPVAGRSSPPTPPLKQLSSSSPEMQRRETDIKHGDKRTTSGKHSASPQQLLPPAPHPSTPPSATSSSEKAQLVCGTCRKLLLYPQGAKWVQCPGCQEVNFVLEAHEVGQVKCGGCNTLLMYPHGAPAVQCSSCRFVTEIGENNMRPPLSVQQAQRRRRSRRAH